MVTNQNNAKKAVGKAAASLIADGMIVGLGTGSTAYFFIESLIERCQQGLTITAIATSKRSEDQGRAGGILFSDINQLTTVDIVVDGADEIDFQKRMIKGGGGALVREKIVASMAREMVVIIDESKLVSQLGAFPLPVEVIPFACEATLYKIRQLGYPGVWRSSNGKRYVTDNGNYIVDISFPAPCHEPEKDHAILRSIPGVVDTGFFFNLAGRVLIGKSDGTVEER